MDDARTLEKEIDEKIEALSDSSDIEDEKEPEDSEDGNRSPVLGCDSVEKQGFFDNMSQDQVDAGKYLLSKLNKRFSCFFTDLLVLENLL